MNKVTKCQLVKRKIFAKWHAWTIPRHHYLLNCLNNLKVVILRKYFTRIREHALWHPLYIKTATDTITNEGYIEINNVTNNLVKEGYNPD